MDKFKVYWTCHSCQTKHKYGDYPKGWGTVQVGCMMWQICKKCIKGLNLQEIVNFFDNFGNKLQTKVSYTFGAKIGSKFKNISRNFRTESF